MTGYIYIHTNKINGKKYVGQTIQRPNDRWHGGSNYSGSPKFYNAIKKYGWDNFDHEVIPAYVEELDFLECEFIKKFNTINNGYNLNSGGNKNKTVSKETRKRLSESHYISNSKQRAVLCIETGEVFKSAHIAGRHVDEVCKGIRKTAGGYHWRYVE